MPKLKNLTCHVQWADTGAPFQEYQTCYGDGVVETYIVVPNRPQPFTIRLTSKGFIFEGLATVVFIDGHYQCNRNRVNLVPSKKGVPRERTEIDFLFRQKEKSVGDEVYMGREWRFDDHNIVPELPEGVTNSHFNDLGTIEVIVLRCSAKTSDETNASTTSSGAESDILGEKEEDTEATATTETEKDVEEKADVDEAKPAPAAKDEGEPFPFGGLFDGPSDHGHHPYPPPNETFGNWAWPSQPSQPHSYDRQQSYRPNYNGVSDANGRWSSYHDPTYPHHADPYSGAHHSTGPLPPSNGHHPRPEKKVHFDYGHREPAADHNRYWDGYDPPDQQTRGPFPSHRYYTPGLSEWHGHLPNRHDHRPHLDFAGHYPQTDAREYSRYGHSAGQTETPYPNPPFTQRPPHAQFPTPAPSHSTYTPGPSPRAPLPWMAAQPVPTWAPHSGYGLHKPHYSSYFPQQHSPYPPNGGVPFVPQAASEKLSSEKTGSRQDQDTTTRRPGSLDPAKDENNPNDGGQPGVNASDVNKASNAGNQDDWATGNNNNENSNGAGSNDWDTGNNDNQNNADNWQNDQNQQTTGDWNTDGNQASNGDWGNNGGNQETNTNWNTNNQNNNVQHSWTGNKDAPNSSGEGNTWGTNTGNTGGGVTNSSAASNVRPLYGPHGAYYAVQSSTAPEIACDAEEEPRYDVPQSFVDEFGSSKQVQPGKGYLYCKKRCRPDYLDELDEPYARFVFKYRTKEEIKKEINLDIDVEPSGNEEVQAFQNMPKDDLIQMLLRAKGALGGKIPSPPPEGTKQGEETALKGVAVDPPAHGFLDYDIPLRGGNGNGGANSGVTPGKGGNDDWNTTPANDNSNNANNDEWGGASNDNNSNNNHNNSSNNDTSWNSGGDGWSNRNDGGTNNDNNNASGGGWDGRSDTPRKSSNSTAAGSPPTVDATHEFSKESWDQARLQQQNGPPPPPPPRRDSGISPKTKASEQHPTGAAETPTAPGERYSDLPAAGQGYGYHNPSMPGGWSYDYQYPGYAHGPASYAGSPRGPAPAGAQPAPWEGQHNGGWS